MLMIMMAMMRMITKVALVTLLTSEMRSQWLEKPLLLLVTLEYECHAVLAAYKHRRVCLYPFSLNKP